MRHAQQCVCLKQSVQVTSVQFPNASQREDPGWLKPQEQQADSAAWHACTHGVLAGIFSCVLAVKAQCWCLHKSNLAPELLNASTNTSTAHAGVCAQLLGLRIPSQPKSWASLSPKHVHNTHMWLHTLGYAPVCVTRLHRMAKSTHIKAAAPTASRPCRPCI
jgi:hypothetical protein